MWTINIIKTRLGIYLQTVISHKIDDWMEVVWRADLLPPLLHWDEAEKKSEDSWHNFMRHRNVINPCVTWFHHSQQCCCDYVSVWWVCRLQSANKRLYGASYSVVLQLFKVEATRLGLAGSTDLQTPVPAPQRDLSFVYLTFNNLKSCRMLG